MCMAMIAGCKSETLDTDQYTKSEVALNVYGPQPVMRGGQLRFLGSNLQKVTEVIIPGVSPITDIEVVTEGVPSEIRITVPKDGPEPGLVTLKTSDGKEIITKTELTYSEPIVLESFSPETVKAGDEITIKGDYFNHIHEVVFPDEVLVSEKDFISHTRYEIKVRVPVEARTGRLGLGDIDEINNEDENLIPNVMFFNEVLTVAQPEVTGISAPRYKAGETVTITGKNFGYVASVVLPGVTIADFKVSSANNTLTFVLPAEAGDGEVVLVAKSGVETVAGTIKTVVPTEVASAPQPVKAGAVMTISGKDLDLVTVVELPNAGEVEFENGDVITFTMPDTAREGETVLHMANGKTVNAAFTLVKPAGFTYSANPAAAGSDITITGTDLDLVKSVTFGGDLTVEVEAEETSITVAVPTTATAGVLKFNLANGTSVEGEELGVDKPTACYITELPAEGTEIFGGTVLIVPVENEDKLESVEVNGESVKFLLNAKTLYISLPDMAGDGTTIRLVSSNGAVEYTIDCIPNNIQNKVIWNNGFTCAGWNGNQDLAWGGFDWSSIDLSAGEVSLVLDITPTNPVAWSFISFRTGTSWGEFEPAIGFEITAGTTSIEIPFTQSMLDQLLANNGLVLTGDNYTLNKITVKTVLPLGTVIWEGSLESGNYAQNYELGGDDNSSWRDAGIALGDVITLEFECLDLSEWSIQVYGGHWGSMLAPQFNQDNTDGSIGSASITVDETILANLSESQRWGKSIILQGNNVVFKKITLL